MNAKNSIVRFSTNRKIRIFFLFLLLSSIFWFFSTLSEKYNYLTSFDLEYYNIPEKLIFQNKPNNQITAQIETTGFSLIAEKIHRSKLKINVSDFYKTGRYKYFFLPNHHIPNLQKQLSDIKIEQFLQDSIFVYLGELKTKKVPVKANVHVTYKSGYKLTESLLINPDSVVITGAEKIIDSIRFIETKNLNIDNVSDNFSKKVTIKKLNNSLKILDSICTISGKVAKFTQGEIEVPIQIANLPTDSQIEIFPKKAIITYEVSFENYPKINNNSFIVFCEYPTNLSQQEKKLQLFIKKKPAFIQKYNLQTNEVKYLIKK